MDRSKSETDEVGADPIQPGKVESGGWVHLISQFANSKLTASPQGEAFGAGDDTEHKKSGNDYYRTVHASSAGIARPEGGIMKKFKKWLICRVLPVWARESLLQRIDALEEENRQLREQIRRLNAYTAGLETGIRNQRKIIIQNGERGT